MTVELVRWGVDDLPVLQRANTWEMTRYFGGPESDEALAQQHSDYLSGWETGEMRMFRVDVDGVAAGYAGWWEEVHDGTPVYEVGCSIHPDWQGRGIALTALRETLRLAAELGDRPLVVGYAHVDNAASNALCARAGFTLTGTAAFPPEGDVPGMSVNVWMIDVSHPMDPASEVETERAGA